MSVVQNKNKIQRYFQARKARDARFDGLFFVAVKSTGIYCRPICPATAPLEKNVEYHESAFSAAQSGYRPCLRCRPDSAPQSCAWLGSETSFQRALGLIQQGVLSDHSVEVLAQRLGISGRYLRELFQVNLGTSPKKYAIYQQCLFAKQLLHQSRLKISDIAFASGFNSVRRFNEAMQEQLKLTPRDIRKGDKGQLGGLTLTLSYRPPFAWSHMLNFLERRVIPNLEWCDGVSYGRTIQYEQTKGYFTIKARPDQSCFNVDLHLDNYTHLKQIVSGLRALFDVDAPIAEIDRHLESQVGDVIDYLPGLRVPGIWGEFEAGVRAILGQQVSVAAARNLVIAFVENLGERMPIAQAKSVKLFPTPAAVVDHPLDFFRMPQARKDTLRRLAEHFLTHDQPKEIDAWLDLKGIGPWTVNYVKLRATKDPDIWLAGDAGLKNALKVLGHEPDLNASRPWRSYLTMQIWNQL